MDRSRWRRRAIRKLDFENCEVTTVRMRNRFRTLRSAKEITEYEDEVISSSQSQDDFKRLSPEEEEEEEEEKKEVDDSPVLFRKRSNQRRIPETPSPILIAKQKSVLTKRLKFHEEPQPSALTVGESSNATSPVFKIKSGAISKKPRSTQADKSDKSSEIIDDDYISPDEYIIEDSSPEPSNEPSEECKISNFLSEVCTQINISEDQSRETLSADIEDSVMQTPIKDEDEMDIINQCDSGRKRKRNKKGGLVERLIFLRQKQASERRIREHRRKIMKIEENWRKNLFVVKAWKCATCLTLKCQQIEVATDDGSLTNSLATDFVYVILNREIGSLFKKIESGTFFRIAPPWKEVRLPGLNAIALLALNVIELIDTKSDVTVLKTGLREMSVTQFKENESLLFDKIFESESNV